MKIYCEHGAISAELRRLRSSGAVELVHFPYDKDSHTKKLSNRVTPSKAQWRDMNISWADIKVTGASWSDLHGSDKFDEILEIIGPNHRRDALHVDTAFKSGCQAFVTKDDDILSKQVNLSRVTSLQFFHPVKDAEAIVNYVERHEQDT